VRSLPYDYDIAFCRELMQLDGLTRLKQKAATLIEA